MKQYIINSFDGTPLFVRVWDEVDNPLGIVQISHGMCEHSGRYSEFAEFLQQKGYIVFADDHRCHGLTERPEMLGYHEGDIFEDTLSDIIFLNLHFSEIYKLPVVLFGHSYGSFLAQAFLERGVPVKGILLCGTAFMGKALPSFGAAMCRGLSKKARPAFFLKVSDILFNGAYKPEKGPSLWTSSDEEKRNAFLTDPMCNNPPSINFYYSMLRGLTTVVDPKNKALINPETPVAIFSGRADPIGGKRSSKAITLYLKLRKHGIKNLRLFVYENARHELINEKHRNVYMQHMLGFINQCFGVEGSPFYT